ncbi:MAG TPA: carboxypeptidase regulatory-like domain-containing protein [Candidatus Polarisedimenticolia bacterium]|nr:carboxypeptidase regulatory-like domain-containing protein [Candidatus Polarisedimenticolia bacterium]
MKPSLHGILKARVLCVLLLTTFAAAQTLTGTVKNSTTGKPAVGDEVVVFKLGQGMEEAGRTKTDAKGQFSFKLEDSQAPHLVRAIHQDVTYHRMAPPGTTSVALEVYDVTKKVDGITVVADIMRVQAAQGQMAVTREFGVQNTSAPPRTQMSERNLEFYVPDGAHIIDESATATTENGNPLKSAPVPEGEKNRYSFIFPLRPGLTRFEVTYQLPYSGSANLDPKSLYPLEHFVVMLPKAMQFTSAATSAGFKLINYPSEPGASVQVASNTTPGQNLAFKISGEGTLETGQESSAQGSSEGQQSSAGGANGAQSNSRPGGGLGPPIDAPDPLQKYRWWILGGFAALLVIGGVYIASRQQSAARGLKQQRTSPRVGTQEEDDYEPAEIVAAHVSRAAGRPMSMLMEGIKEELFQLEIERKQGEISQADYEKAKTALDQTLERALKREAQRA